MRYFVRFLSSQSLEVLDLPSDSRVADAKALLRQRRSNMIVHGQEVVLKYNGAELDNRWRLRDVGIPPGAVLHLCLRDIETVYLSVFSIYNKKTYDIKQELDPFETRVADVRSIISRMSGLPVSVFRLVTRPKPSRLLPPVAVNSATYSLPRVRDFDADKGVELFDIHTLDYYGINIGDTVNVEIWDGWGEFLTWCYSGVNDMVETHLDADPNICNFQLKTALYIAAYNGHESLAEELLKKGIKPDEPIGEHPARVWYTSLAKTADPPGDVYVHPDLQKAPIHVATEQCQLALLRNFVHANPATVVAKDGRGLKPLSIALRLKLKGRKCAQFLLTKQWSKFSCKNGMQLSLPTLRAFQGWAERAREKATNAKQAVLKERQNSMLAPLPPGGAAGAAAGAAGNGPSKRNVGRKHPFVSAFVTVDGYLKQMNSHKESGPMESTATLSEHTRRQRQRQAAKVALDHRRKALLQPEGGRPAVVTRERSTMSGRSFYVNTAAANRLANDEQADNADNADNADQADNPNTEAAAANGDQSSQQAKLALLGKVNNNAPKRRRSKKLRGEDGRIRPRKQFNPVEILVPLPSISHEHIQRPSFFQCDNAATQALKAYDSRRDGPRHSAVRNLALAARFSQKSWLKQVQLAMYLSERKVKQCVDANLRSDVDLHELLLSKAKIDTAIRLQSRKSRRNEALVVG